TRRLHPQREAVVDGNLRLTYEEFFDRCDRWSAALQRLGVHQGDRVAYIAPNVHQQLESFYAVPQIGAVLVPINFRLATDDFAYIIEHSGATVVCACAEYLEAVDSIRGRIPDPPAAGNRLPLPLDAADVPCQRMDLCLGGDRRRRHPCLSPQAGARGSLRADPG